MNRMARPEAFRYASAMSRTLNLFAAALFLCFAAPSSTAAQSDARDTTRVTGGLSLGISGIAGIAGHGATLVADVMWVGAEMNDGIGLRLLREPLSRRRSGRPNPHGHAVMLVIGGPPTDSAPWFRLDLGMGYVGRQSNEKRAFLKRHGVGVQFGSTIAPKRFGIVRPELNFWAVVGTPAQFLGTSIGVRILDPRQR
jgi:hypothetical protein